MFSLKLVTGPSEPVVSVADLKVYLRVDNDLEDQRIQVMEAAAVKQLEAYTDQKFVTQTWDVFMNFWPTMPRSKWWDGTRDTAISEVIMPTRKITLPIGPAQNITEFSTYSDSQEYAEDMNNYSLDVISPRAAIGLKLGGVWPTTILRVVNGIRFRVIAGYGLSADVPLEIRQAVQELVAHMYENRGDQNEMAIPPHVLSLVGHLRRNKVGC